MITYSIRRKKLITQMQNVGGGIAIISAAPEVIRSAGTFFPYRYNSNFYYLSGFAESHAMIVIIATQCPKSILFCREKNLEQEIWDGYRLGPKEAHRLLEFDATFDIETIDEEIPKMLSGTKTVFYPRSTHIEQNNKLEKWLPESASIRDLDPILAEMRLFKDAGERAAMQRSGEIAASAQERAMKKTCPGLKEYHLEAEVLHEFRIGGAQCPAYNSIVATGSNACVLHHSAGNAELRNGDLVLVDAGCEFEGYASDVTRTFPVNGVFSGTQKALYEIVLAAQHAAIACALPGNLFIDVHNAAVHVLVQGMLDVGLLEKNKCGTIDDVISSGSYRPFYMHGTGHWIGLDVHDPGDYREPSEKITEDQEQPSRELQPNMVMTIEPGIYVRPTENVPEQYWNIGIRIEDDIVITVDGNHSLTSKAPVAIEEIERLMRR
jgi:Xaa-Pro aminopeptidase